MARTGIMQAATALTAHAHNAVSIGMSFMPRAAACVSRVLNTALIGALLLVAVLHNHPPLNGRAAQIARDCVLMNVGRFAGESALRRDLDIYLIKLRCEAAAAANRGHVSR